MQPFWEGREDWIKFYKLPEKWQNLQETVIIIWRSGTELLNIVFDSEFAFWGRKKIKIVRLKSSQKACKTLWQEESNVHS